MLDLLNRRRILTMPESGKVVVAHPDDAVAAFAAAEREDCPYMLRRIVPAGSVYVFDIDTLLEPVESL